MAALDITERAPLIATDEDGNPVPFTPGSIAFASDNGTVSLSNLYGNGQIDVVAQAVGSDTILVNVAGFEPASIEVVVTETPPPDPQVLTLTLGPAIPK